MLFYENELIFLLLLHLLLANGNPSNLLKTMKTVYAGEK